MIDSGIKQLIQNASLSKRSNWAIVRNGAVAEFSITDTDLNTIYQNFNYDTNTLTVETEKAILELEINDSLTTIIAENANFRCSPWSQHLSMRLKERCSTIKEK
jgi:hypothetical protein